MTLFIPLEYSKKTTFFAFHSSSKCFRWPLRKPIRLFWIFFGLWSFSQSAFSHFSVAVLECEPNGNPTTAVAGSPRHVSSQYGSRIEFSPAPATSAHTSGDLGGNPPQPFGFDEPLPPPPFDSEEPDTKDEGHEGRGPGSSGSGGGRPEGRGSN